MKTNSIILVCSLPSHNKNNNSFEDQQSFFFFFFFYQNGARVWDKELEWEVY